jgi:hypothetical protein
LSTFTPNSQPPRSIRTAVPVNQVELAGQMVVEQPSLLAAGTT